MGPLVGPTEAVAWGGFLTLPADNIPFHVPVGPADVGGLSP